MVKTVDSSGDAVLHSLQEREALWQAVLQTARDAIISIDARGTVSLFNHAAEEMFGYAASEVIGVNVSLLMPQPYRDEHDDYLRNYHRGGEAKAIGRIRRVEGRRKDGAVFPIELSVAIAHAPGDEKLFTAIIRDVSEATAARAQLETHARQQAAVAELGRVALTQSLDETMRSAVSIVIETLAVEHAKILRLESDGDLLLVAGLGWREGLLGQARVKTDRNSQAGFTLLGNEAIIVEDLAADRRFNGPPLLVEHGIVSGVSAVIGARDRPFGVLGAHSRQRRSFTRGDADFLQTIANVLAASVERTHADQDRRRLERQAIESERLAEVGAITAKVVHDLGNPLAAVSMQAQLIKRRIAQGDPTAKIEAPIERILATVVRLDELAHDLSNFAREQRLQLTTFDPHAFLAELIDLWKPVALAQKIELLLLETERLPTLRGDRAKLHRVLENILKNAIEAIDKPGGKIVVRGEILAPDRISICIEDDGRGIANDLDAFRLFETTKSEGSGLGLAVARQIVLAHEGSIDHHGREPKGTTFSVTLPTAGPEI